MAIDCPENFVPEVETRPWKQAQVQPEPKIGEKDKKGPNTLEKQKNILKPLLTIINKDTDSNKSKEEKQTNKKSKSKQKSKKENKQANKSEENLNTSEMQLIHKQIEVAHFEEEEETNLGVPETILNNNAQLEAKKSVSAAPLSASLSSIQFIDEETRSRANLNASTHTSHFIHNNISDSPAVSKLHALADEINDNTASKVSLGKKLFEKQRQHFEEANLEEAVSQSKFGITNNCFVMDHDDEDIVELEELNSKPKAAARPPTPPPRSDAHLTCFNVVSSVNSVDINVGECKAVEQQIFSSTLDVKLFDSTSQANFESETYFKTIQTKSFDITNSQTSPASTLTTKSTLSDQNDKSEAICFNPNKPLGKFLFCLVRNIKFYVNLLF
jgi:hypothetical protein